jgi:ABC-type polysaccharide/polyol phosphate export permease
MNPIARIAAVADKEFRLNLRFPMEYVASNLVTPIKSAILMYLIYHGLLKDSQTSLGVLNKQNFQVYVLIGTTCHSLFIASLSTFRSRMSSEKYWQTIAATLVSPASILEVIMGFIIGSVGIHLCFSILILGVTAYLFSIPLSIFLISIYFLFVITLIGFGFGLVGTTFSLVWEGKAFIFDYSIQIIIFASCFYYPIETLPKFLHKSVALLPTFQASQMIQHLFLFNDFVHFWPKLFVLTGCSLFILCLPALKNLTLAFLSLSCPK